MIGEGNRGGSLPEVFVTLRNGQAGRGAESYSGRPRTKKASGTMRETSGQVIAVRDASAAKKSPAGKKSAEGADAARDQELAKGDAGKPPEKPPVAPGEAGDAPDPFEGPRDRLNEFLKEREEAGLDNITTLRAAIAEAYKHLAFALTERVDAKSIAGQRVTVEELEEIDDYTEKGNVASTNQLRDPFVGSSFVDGIDFADDSLIEYIAALPEPDDEADVQKIKDEELDLKLKAARELIKDLELAKADAVLKKLVGTPEETLIAQDSPDNFAGLSFQEIQESISTKAEALRVEQGVEKMDNDAFRLTSETDTVIRHIVIGQDKSAGQDESRKYIWMTLFGKNSEGVADSILLQATFPLSESNRQMSFIDRRLDSSVHAKRGDEVSFEDTLSLTRGLRLVAGNLVASEGIVTPEDLDASVAGGSGIKEKRPRELAAMEDQEPEELSYRVFDAEARGEIAAEIHEAAEFFGNPELLREAANAVSEALRGTARPDLDQFSGYRKSPYMYNHGDYTQQHRLIADTYLTYPSEPDHPAVHVGFRNGNVHEIVVEQKRYDTDGNPVQETQVIFFGLDDWRAAVRGGQQLIPMFYPLLLDSPGGLVERAPDDYPPLGVFLNFSVLNASGEEQARLYGEVGANTTRDSKRNTVLHGQPGNREVFPWLHDGIAPDGRFGMAVDNEALLPLADTLHPAFFTDEVIAAYERIEAKRKSGMNKAPVHEGRNQWLNTLSEAELGVYETLKDREPDEAIALLFEFARRARKGLQNPQENQPPLLNEGANAREVAHHLFTVTGPIDVTDPKHGAIHGTSMETVEALIRSGFVPGYQSSKTESRSEQGDVSIYPTQQLYHQSKDVRDLLFPYGIDMVNQPGASAEEAKEYAETIAEVHGLLRELQIPLSERLRYAEEITGLLYDPAFFPELQKLGIPREEIVRLREKALSRKGFLITFSPEVQHEQGVTFAEGDAGDADIAIRPGENGLRYGLISGIEALGPEEEAFLERLRTEVASLQSTEQEGHEAGGASTLFVRESKITYADAFNLYRFGLLNEFQTDNRGVYRLPESLDLFLEAFRTTAVSTQSDFFREPGALDYIKDTIVPSLIDREKIRIASVGTSIGADIYSLLMKNWEGRDKFILRGYDVNPEVLVVARDGEYIVARDMSHLSRTPLEKIYQHGPQENRSDVYRVEEREDGVHFIMSEEAQNAVDFREGDILAGPLETKQDIILLQNVLKHFSPKGREQILRNISQSLHQGGWLVCENVNGFERGSAYSTWMKDLTKYGFERIEDPSGEKQIYRMIQTDDDTTKGTAEQRTELPPISWTDHEEAARLVTEQRQEVNYPQLIGDARVLILGEDHFNSEIRKHIAAQAAAFKAAGITHYAIESNAAGNEILARLTKDNADTFDLSEIDFPLEGKGRFSYEEAIRAMAREGIKVVAITSGSIAQSEESESIRTENLLQILEDPTVKIVHVTGSAHGKKNSLVIDPTGKRLIDAGINTVSVTFFGGAPSTFASDIFPHDVEDVFSLTELQGETFSLDVRHTAGFVPYDVAGIDYIIHLSEARENSLKN